MRYRLFQSLNHLTQIRFLIQFLLFFFEYFLKISSKLKTPTNSNIKKTDDGKQVYVEFIKKSLSLLKPDGFLACIIPSLWLKPDKAGLYDILTNKKIIKLVCLSTSQTQKAFNYKAQTPTCYFLIQNTDVTKNNKIIQLY